jgi:gliding motility-associated-like protein
VHTIPESRAFCPGEVLEIGVPAEPGYSYLWQPIEWLQSPQQAQTLAKPPSAMVYTLIVRSDTHTTAHCREQRFTVALGTDGCPMQNILSPNADGINDLLDLGTFAQAPVLEVYDRWGTLIYSSQAYQNDWDGGNAPDGVYWYVVAPQAPEGRTVVALMLMR